MMDPANDVQHPPRRNFLKKSITLILGAVSILSPAAAGLAVFLDPLRRKSSTPNWVRITTLNALPQDGRPRRFPVVARHSDAWTTYPETPIGAVYLRRPEAEKVQALNVICPHAGCYVNFQPGQNRYLCPCHNSSFALDGQIADAESPSPRGLDSLEVAIRNQQEVWVRFQNFQTGLSQKVART